MIPNIWIIGCLPLTFALPASDSSSAPVPFTKESWTNYDVDDWLPSFMEDRKIPVENFLHEFPKAVGHPMDCELDSPCEDVEAITTDKPKQDIQIRLVLAGLTHFNDLFRMIRRLWSNDFFLDNPIKPGLPFRTALVGQFSDIYADFSIGDVSTIAPPEINRVFLNSIWYIPGAIPNEALVATVRRTMQALAPPAWAWKDNFQTTNGQQMTNIEQTVENIQDAWVAQYHQINKYQDGMSSLDFLKGGQMVDIKYAKDLKTVGWHTQAYMMFTRQILALVLEANQIIVHRASYTGMEPNDTSMELPYTLDDPYVTETYSPVHFGLDQDNNITRYYSPSQPHQTFDYIGVPPRVVWGQSWQCFESTNNNDFGSNFARAWDQPAYQQQSLFIADWDGTSDGFDAKNPLCTFNLPVNNQPSDIKTSWFTDRLITACPGSIVPDLRSVITIDYSLYHAVMLASDAYVSSTVYKESDNTTDTLTAACTAGAATADEWRDHVLKDFKTNFLVNLAIGSVFKLGDIANEVKSGAVAVGSSVRGGWNAIFRERLPVVPDRPPLPPLVAENVPAEHPAANEQGSGDNGDGGQSGQAGGGEKQPGGSNDDGEQEPSPEEKPDSGNEVEQKAKEGENAAQGIGGL